MSAREYEMNTLSFSAEVAFVVVIAVLGGGPIIHDAWARVRISKIPARMTESSTVMTEVIINDENVIASDDQVIANEETVIDDDVRNHHE